MARAPENATAKTVPEEKPHREPGMLSVIGKMLKFGAESAAIGAVVGAAANVALGYFGMGVDQALPLGLGTVGSGAAAGAMVGAVVGMPVGSLVGANQMRTYYRDVAIPEIKTAEHSRGKMLGAQLEQAALQHEQASRQYRDIIQQRSPQYGEQVAMSLEKMEPMGRA